jgi:ATP-dependent DNA helicase RecG
MLRLCCEPKPLVAMLEVVGRQDRSKFRDGLITPLIEPALLELTIPNKPRSRMQRYRSTRAGLAMLENEQRGEP